MIVGKGTGPESNANEGEHGGAGNQRGSTDSLKGTMKVITRGDGPLVKKEKKTTLETGERCLNRRDFFRRGSKSEPRRGVDRGSSICKGAGAGVEVGRKCVGLGKILPGRRREMTRARRTPDARTTTVTMRWVKKFGNDRN